MTKKFTTDIVIGLEIHAELATDTKLFCGCKTYGDDNPNSRTCEVCLGMPGSKPVLNKKAVDYALRLCLALGCKISPELIFSRKSYFYPDMAKNYQISQYEIPLGIKGKLKLHTGKTVGITRVHMEEDPAALIHPSGMTKSKYVLVDYNRSGDPLAEIVTEPDLESPEEARLFMKQLITILNYLGIFDVNRCIIKADANISIKETNYTRVEIKNITGFKEIERALKYEVERQKQEVKSVVQETRAWDSDVGITRSMRKKEVEEEYGYIIDPDLVKTEVTKGMIEEIKKDMPELAQQKVKKYIKEFNISEEDARVIAAERLLAEMFEKVAEEVDPNLAAKWLRRELVRVLNYNKKEMKDLALDEKYIIELLKMVEDNEITDNVAQKILEKLIEKPFSPRDYVRKIGAKKIADEKQIRRFCEEAIKENPQAVEDYKAGEKKSLQFLIGQVMRKTKGQADPAVVNKIMKELIE
ncbi:Asp-tRNA(Asn)/Glu-tRNA(Gln) amidotransferase subunit GatB [Candidatus Woesearchaeota archaeon]|nr:Asp-tRNA(Asn)/Glu-tRNA(Gln) amidotransferase subunit GatB [Candidatus Woesearchaeota archaeon]